MTTPNPATTGTPAIVPWTTSASDRSTQRYIRVSTAVAAQIEILRFTPFSTDQIELHQQATALQRLLPPQNLSIWEGLPSAELVARLRTERDAARAERDAAQIERDEHMAGEDRLQQRLANAEVVMNRLARTEPSASRDRAEKIADPDRFDGTREKLKPFKDQLILKTSGNSTKFPNIQHKLRYAYQFLTGKAQRTMRIHIRRTPDANEKEMYEIVFDTFAAFLAALDRHFGDPDEKHTAALALDRLRQANREFCAYYADFQELMDVLEPDDTSWRHALKRGLNQEMLNALAIFPTPKEESFGKFVERLNELDCRLPALAIHTRT